MMKLNSDQSLRTGSDVFRAFRGSWAAAERVAERNADGVLVIRRSVLRGAQDAESIKPTRR